MDVRLYDRQPGEGTKAHDAFCTYRDMGPDRSLRAVAGVLGKARQLLERWSTRYRWVERALAWDDDQDALKCQTQLQAVEEMSQRHVALALAFQEKAVQRLQGMTTADIDRMTITQLCQLMR